MEITLTKTINIKVSPEKVLDYLNNVSKWAEWVVHNVTSVRQGDNGFWLMDRPRGTSNVKINPHKATGVLDHDFINPGKGYWKVPSRVVEWNLGSHFMITFTKPEQMPDETFEIGMKLLDEELFKLKEILEK